MFDDRKDAGKKLAARLRRLAGEKPIVFALPRGGVVVGFEIAKALKAPLDVVLVRKLGAPDQPELALGAVVEGETPELVTNPEIVAALGLSASNLEKGKHHLLREIAERQRRYRGGRKRTPATGRTVIVVDDGIATGATVRAALRVLRKEGPKQIILAVPVAPPETLERLAQDADDTLCLEAPPDFGAVGFYYADFRQTTDAEVIALLRAAEAFA